MDAVLSVQGVSAPVKKKSFFSKFTRLNMLRLARAVIPAAVLMMFFPQLAMAAGSSGQDLMASGNTTVIRDNEGRVFARQGEVMNPLQYVPFNQTLYFINGDDPAQVAWMKRQTPPTLESKIILVQGSIPEMQKSLDSRVYFDQNGVLCQRLGIDQVPARVSAVPGDRFLKVEFIPAEEGRK